MHLLLVVNPVASSVTPRHVTTVTDVLTAGHETQVATTLHRGHATELAREAAERGVEGVVVMGGDGTLNEVANGLAGTSTTLAPLPGGSTNVYARTMGLSHRIDRALTQIITALNQEQTQRIGLGSLDGRRFLFHAGIGFDAAVVEWVDRKPKAVKRHAAHPLFAAGVAATWIQERRRQRNNSQGRAVTLTLDGGERIEARPYVVVSKTSPYTFVGRRRLIIAPEATQHSPLAVTALTSLALGPFTKTLASALGSGVALHRSATVVNRHDIQHCVMDADEPVPYQVDGEYLGTATHLEIRYESAQLMIVNPEFSG